MIISSMKYIEFENGKVISWHVVSSNVQLAEKLRYYHSIIGVIAYEETDISVMWNLNSQWYSTDQIERMIKLPIFA